MNKYDIYRYEMQFQQDFLMNNPRTKDRPCVIKEMIGDEAVIMAMITTKSHKNQYTIRDWKEAGLDRPSYINYGVIQRVKVTDLGKYVGRLSDFDIQRIKSQKWDESLEVSMCRREELNKYE